MKNKSLKDLPNGLGFLTKDGRGGSCLISTKESENIARFEGLPINNPSPMTPEKRKETEEKIISTIPEDDRKYLGDLLSKNHEELDKSDNHTTSIRRDLRISDEHSFEVVNGKLVGYHGMNHKIVLVPSGVTTIGESVFDKSNSESIKIIILPETVESIEKYAFGGCDNLRYICFPTSLKKIGLRPFNNPEHLKHLYIPDNVMECDHLGLDLRLETLRLPLHLFNNTDCTSQINLHTLILGLPEEDGMTPSQDKIDLRKIGQLRSHPNIVIEPYASSHISKDIDFSNRIFAVNGCMLLSDSNGRDYIPEEESDFDFTYVISIPGSACVVPEAANVLDHKCGWYHKTPLLYIPSTIEFIAPDAFKSNITFVTPASNGSNLMHILSKVKFNFNIITI